MGSQTVQLVECEFDCGMCGEVHRYTEGTLFDLHQDLRTGNKRWIYADQPEANHDNPQA